MKVILICPADRSAVPHLADRSPLVAAPLLGRSVVEYWLEALATRGAKHVIVLASDRPHAIRALIGDGRRWGLRAEVVPTARELTIEEARAKYRRDDATEWLPNSDVVLTDHLPDQPLLPLFESYASWLAAARAWMPRTVTPGRIGVREIRPGIWVGLRAEIDRTAQLMAPCWIGDHVRIGRHVHIGPGAMIDDRVVIDDAARVTESVIGPDTYVGKFVSVERSLAQGAQLINWQMSSVVTVPDAFLLGSLADRPSPVQQPNVAGQFAAVLAMLVTSPFALLAIIASLIRSESPWQIRLGLRTQRGSRPLPQATFAFYELTGARNWLRRWPQFWSVVRGDLAWIGNRPLRPTEAMALSNDFERLWLNAPVGLISLADARGCPEGVTDEACAHASYFAVNSSRRLIWYIISRAVIRAALVWPVRMQRQKDATVPLEQLVPKQEI
jgi:hypothetical protein